VLEHAEIEENEQTDWTVKQAVVKSLLPQDSEKLLLVYIQRGLTETQTKKH
jgi:hypothetical protein